MIMDGFGERARALLLVPVTIGKDYNSSRGGWLSIGCNLIATVLYVIAFSTVGWANVRTDMGLTTVTRDIGLWQECHSAFGCSYISPATATDSIRAAQAFSVLALVTMAGSVVTHCVYLFDTNCLGNPLLCLAVFILLPLNAVFLLITVCVYGSKWSDPKYLSPQHKTKHSYSFALALVSFLLEIFAGCFMIFEIISQAEQVRRGVYYLKSKMSKRRDQAPEDTTPADLSSENIQLPGEFSASHRNLSGRDTNSKLEQVVHSANAFGISNAAVKLQQNDFPGYTREVEFEDIAFGQEVPSLSGQQSGVRSLNSKRIKYSTWATAEQPEQEERLKGRRPWRQSDGRSEKPEFSRQHGPTTHNRTEETKYLSTSGIQTKLPYATGSSNLRSNQYDLVPRAGHASFGPTYNEDGFCEKGIGCDNNSQSQKEDFNDMSSHAPNKHSISMTGDAISCIPKSTLSIPQNRPWHVMRNQGEKDGRHRLMSENNRKERDRMDYRRSIGNRNAADSATGYISAERNTENYV